jgi:protein-histidine pros-kinase
MKLLAKFTLVFSVLCGTGLLLAATFGYRFLHKNAREEVLREADLLLSAALASRDYTSKQIRPLLEKQPEHQAEFLPQAMPPFGATETFAYLRRQHPEYSYKEAALNPTNPRDRAVDGEADLINDFRLHRQFKQLTGERDTPTGRALYLAHPIVAEGACLECHETPDRAPIALVRRYGPSNGFGWSAGDVVAAQIVTVPMSIPVATANRAFRNLLLYLAGVFILTLLVLDAVVLFTVARPATRLAAMADEISQGNLDTPELPVPGKDEISILAASFNRMRRSLVTAIKMLEE